MSERVSRNERKQSLKQCLKVCPHLGSVACPRFTAVMIDKEISGNKSRAFAADLVMFLGFNSKYQSISSKATEEETVLSLVEAGTIVRIDSCLESVQQGNPPLNNNIDDLYFEKYSSIPAQSNQ